ncbi:MAG: GTPase Era [Acidobacteria bacterium]|nr:GTPase Era [Acidobacteriota bacterium]
MNQKPQNPDEQPASIPATRSGMVAIVGRPNVGKSSLLNQLMGSKISIISDKPQTTRQRILGVLTEPRGQVIFFDTPGLHKPGFEMNRRMVQSVYEAMRSADLLLHLIDISQSFGKGEQFMLDVVKKIKAPAILVLNKIDVTKKSRILEIIDHYRGQHAYAAFVPTCALSGDGSAVLLDEIFRQLPPGGLLYDAGFITDFPERFMIAELIREKVLALTRQEIPYVSGVIIDLYDTSRLATDNLVHIEASVIVEKSSQKGIIIGRQGGLLKQIGTQARQDIESFLGQRVYLGLFVRTEPDWRNNSHILKEMGLLY